MLRDNSLMLKDEMVLFALVAWAFVAAALGNAIQCVVNFNHGLKDIFKRQEGLQKLEEEGGEDAVAMEELKKKRFTMD